MAEHSAEKDAHPLCYLRELQAEAKGGFHRGLHAWVDDDSSVARVLRDYATRVFPPGSCPQGHTRAAGRWCGVCGQHGSHHTETHPEFTCCTPSECWCNGDTTPHRPIPRVCPTPPAPGPAEQMGGVGHGEDTVVIFHGDPVDKKSEETLTDPSMSDEERIEMLEGLAVGLSPMHPKMWERIDAEARSLGAQDGWMMR